MRTWNRTFFIVSLALCVLAASSLSAQVTIDNGVAGDGRWEVEVEDAGDSFTGSIDPVGATGLTEVIYEYYTYIDNGADGAGVLLSASTTVPAALTGPNEVTSSGSFAGPNGPIAWTSVSTIAPGSTVLNNQISFSMGAAAFGTVRVISYLDEDVVGSSDDHLIVLGTPGADDFQLLTLDSVSDIGVGHTASYSTSTDAGYVGWAADQYSDLQTLISGAGATYSVPGVVDTTSLPPIVDPRYPADPAYGPADITNAFAFDLTPTSDGASVAFALGGSPDGQPPGGGGGPSVLEIPTLGEWGFLALAALLGGAALLQLRRRTS